MKVNSVKNDLLYYEVFTNNMKMLFLFSFLVFTFKMFMYFDEKSELLCCLAVIRPQPPTPSPQFSILVYGVVTVSMHYGLLDLDAN